MPQFTDNASSNKNTNKIKKAILLAQPSVSSPGRIAKHLICGVALLFLTISGIGCGVAPIVDNPGPKSTPTPNPTPTPTPTPSPTPTPVPGLAIIFSSARALDGSDSAPGSQPSNIWGVNSDGSGTTPLTSLTNAGALSQDAVYSPDGTKIAFISSRAFDGSDSHDVNQVFNIWVMNTDGTGAKALTHLTANKADCTRPAWSPDGKKIAFTSGRALDGSDNTNPGGPFVVTNVWVINADGTSDIPLTLDNSIFGGGTTNSSDPVWSPDGTKIIFTSSRALDGTTLPNLNSTPNIWIMNAADGTGRLPLTFYTAGGVTPTSYSWFPNGSKVLYSINAALTGDAPGITNIWAVDPTVFPLNPKSLTNLTNAVSLFPSISPDGSKIAFVSSRLLDGSDNQNTNNTTNVWIMNVDGSSPTHLTNLAAMGPASVPLGGSRPDQNVIPWFKDGSKIAFMSARALDGSDTPNANFTVNVWTMNADGSAQKPVTKVTASGGECEEVNWHP